ncbi:hypothetical protein [Riemerella anatipestifer]|uniref:Uncharacterized protein n=2 Tax=Riemerella anatipestifer TaxID=34085 RepID=A0AAP6HG39_RIEAN|nr:hypothetical protein [Riemerella anatipestifer]MCO7354454.1 hypothetical protein [Riemerella anatipestifer]MCU7541565.1 hypothetical protein [Riemerella anatipestifer]MCW0509195.1 hypothetical protein [Riemerella anatipestifer]MCW0517408.1 hypothetical protein [Riemerella anatipestifer]MDW3556181.1 hypothetical protein [Riemerella anatipestifer]
MKKLLLAALIGLNAMSCTDRNKDDYNPQLPPITQTGAWTFGCKINGEVMIPQDATQQGPPGGGPLKGLVFGNAIDSRAIVAIDARHGRGGIIIKIPNEIMGKVGTFNFEEIYGGFSVHNENKLYMGAEKNNRFYDSMKDSGRITFTRNDSIVAGTFYCTLRNKDNPNDIIEVTEGRFDLKTKKY